MATVVFDAAVLKREVTNLMRLPTGDPLSRTQFFVEAQLVMRRAKDAGVDVPNVVFRFLADADLRAKDPLLAARQTADLVAWLSS